MIKFGYKKFKGSAILVLTVVTATMIAAIALSLVKLNSAATSTVLMNKTQVQAQQYALAEASLVRAMRYTEMVTYYTDAGRTNPQTIGDHFSKDVTISDSPVVSGTLEQRTVNIKIYHDSDPDNPVINLDVPRYNKERSYLPPGAIVAWVGTGTPSNDSGAWLECNGSSTFGYPLINNSEKNIFVSSTPNFVGRYLVGAGSGGLSSGDLSSNLLSANLPNITGSVSFTSGGVTVSSPSNVFYGSSGSKLSFNASKANSIYTSENNVRPETMKIRYFIKAE